MKINKLLIFFLSLFAFFIVYLIFFNNDSGSYEKFEVEDTQEDDTIDATANDDIIDAIANDDIIDTSAKDDIINTSAKDDIINTSAKDDIIDASAKDDIIDTSVKDDIIYDIIDSTKDKKDKKDKKNKNNNSFNDLRKDKLLDTIFEDPLFNDVVLYENNYTTYKSGLDECIETCNGMCVEFGQTSNAHCYPNPTGAISKTSFYESLRDDTYKTENYDEKTDNFTFPNLR